MTLQPNRFAIHLREVDERSVRIGVDGEIDMITAPSFGQVLRTQVSARRNVVLDLSRTTFMDSSGLRVVIDGMRRSRRHGGRLILEPEVPHQIRRLFEITGVDALLLAENADLTAQPH